MRPSATWCVQGRPAARSEGSLPARTRRGPKANRGYRSADALRNTDRRSYTGQYLKGMLGKAARQGERLVEEPILGEVSGLAEYSIEICPS